MQPLHSLSGIADHVSRLIICVVNRAKTQLYDRIVEASKGRYVSVKGNCLYKRWRFQIGATIAMNARFQPGAVSTCRMHVQGAFGFRIRFHCPGTDR